MRNLRLPAAFSSCGAALAALLLAAACYAAKPNPAPAPAVPATAAAAPQTKAAEPDTLFRKET